MGVRFGETELIAFIVAFKAAVDDEVFARIAPRKGYLQIALPGVGRGRFVGGKEVLRSR